MKVLEEGKWKTVWNAEMLCSEKGCEAKLLVEEGDVNPVFDSSPAKYSFTCPVCGTNVLISASSIPIRVKNVADEKKRWSSFD